MFGSNVLEVGLGLALIYLILSLICSSVHELIASVLGLRAKNLESGLKELLQDPQGAEGGLLSTFYEHPLIDGLYPGTFRAPGAAAPTPLPAPPAVPGLAATPTPPRMPPSKPAVLPCYIPPRTFALTILDLIKPGQATSPSGATSATPAPGEPDRSAIPPARVAALAAAGEAPSAAPGSVAALRDALATSPLFQANPDVSRTMLTLIDAAGTDMGQVRTNIEDWFDASMERVASTYKRRTQYVILLIGMILAVAVNADTFAIGNALSRNKALQETLVKDSAEFRALVSPTSPTPRGAASGTTSTNQQWLAAKIQEVEPLGLPIGWPRPQTAASSHWATAIPGWIFTGLAISLGAPFWFDILSRIMVVRSTLRPGERS